MALLKADPGAPASSAAAPAQRRRRSRRLPRRDKLGVAA